MTPKLDFELQLVQLAEQLKTQVSTEDGQWTIKGFVDIFSNVYTISSDTKVLSKILEIHLLPQIMGFAQMHGYKVILADHQNYYPDISFVSSEDESIKFAVDFKTTYRNAQKPHLCNGFTLGSHGKYFQDRTSRKNIQFPYNSYSGHFCLGIIYDRGEEAGRDGTSIHKLEELKSITSVVKNLHFFVAEKWKIASDKSGSGNTANIGSIHSIDDITHGRGMFSKLGEAWFDDYWMNYGNILIKTSAGVGKKITSLEEFVKYRNGDASRIVGRNTNGMVDA